MTYRAVINKMKKHNDDKSKKEKDCKTKKNDTVVQPPGNDNIVKVHTSVINIDEPNRFNNIYSDS